MIRFDGLRGALAVFAVVAGWLVGLGSTTDTQENVVIDEALNTYIISEKNGEIEYVKSIEETVFTSLRKDDYADAVAFYNDNISIDKATAPGAKPYYRSWQSSDVFYDGSRICYMHVPVKRDKKVKVTFHQTYKAPEHFCQVNLASSYPIAQGKTIIKVPAKLAEKIKVDPYCLPDNIVLTHEKLPDGAIEYTATAINLPAFKYEKGAPSSSMIAPQLIVTGMFSNVQELYDHFRKYTEGSDIGGPEIDKLASEIAAKASSPQGIADSIASWVRRNIRYRAIEHGEYAFRPETAPDVLKNRAGDCKGSANLIKALLKSVGLDGRLVWTGTNGDIPFEWEKVPALCSGNHVIAACVLPDTTLFLDGTTTWAAPGYIPPSIRGRQVIIENGEDCIIERVTDTGIKEDGEHINAVYSIDGNDLAGELYIQLQGTKKSVFLEASANTEPRNREVLAKKILNYPRKSGEATEIDMQCNPAQKKIIISGKVVEKNAAKKIGEKIYLDLQPLRDAMLEQVDTGGRQHPYTLQSGYKNSYKYLVKIPEGYQVEAIPAPLEIEDDWFDATIVYEENDGVLECIAKIETKALEADVSEIEKRNAGVKAMRRASDTQIILKPIDP